MRLAESDDSKIRAMASAWLARRDAGLSEADEAAFQRWRTAKPEHADAAAELESTWVALDTPRSTGMTEVVRSEIKRRARRRVLRHRVIGVASLAILIFAGVWSQKPSPTLAPKKTTARVVEPARERLSDGSLAEVPPGARIQNEYDPQVRRIKLLSGEGYFIVKKDPNRPFVVQAGPFTVRAVGTQFAVSLAADYVEVVVTEGLVRVERDGAGSHQSEPALVSYGHRLTLPRSAIAATLPTPVQLSPIQLSQHLTWRTPRLEFTDTSIAEAIALFNQHNAVRLKAGDRAVAELLVTGIFRADNVQGFVNVLEKSFGIRADRNNPVEIILHSPK